MWIVVLYSVQQCRVIWKRCKTDARQTRQMERKQAAAAQAQARVFPIDGDNLQKVENRH